LPNERERERERERESERERERKLDFKIETYDLINRILEIKFCAKFKIF
jgi:hypothetical protein